MAHLTATLNEARSKKDAVTGNPRRHGEHGRVSPGEARTARAQGTHDVAAAEFARATRAREQQKMQANHGAEGSDARANESLKEAFG